MDTENTTQTIYSGSVTCPGCKRLMTPIEHFYSGSTGHCADCRDQLYAKQAKSIMSNRR